METETEQSKAKLNWFLKIKSGILKKKNFFHLYQFQLCLEFIEKKKKENELQQKQEKIIPILFPFSKLEMKKFSVSFHLLNKKKKMNHFSVDRLIEFSKEEIAFEGFKSICFFF